MKPLEYRFSLDMNDEAAQVFCNVRNGDDCSKLIVSLQEDGRAYTFDDDVHAYFLAKKSDGNSLYTECSVENNTIIYEFTEQTAPVSGTVVCQFLLLSGSNRLTTPIFRLEVFDNVSVDPASPQSLPEYTALIDATQDAIDATDDMRDLIEEIEYKLEHGEFKGDKGDKGDQGNPGADGFSPTATVTKSGHTATITITDKNGTTAVPIYDGDVNKMKLAPLNPTAEQIAAMSSGQLYSDTTNHKGVIKGRQEFYDTSVAVRVFENNDGQNPPLQTYSDKARYNRGDIWLNLSYEGRERVCTALYICKSLWMASNSNWQYRWLCLYGANSEYYTKTDIDSMIPTVPTNVSAFTNDSGYLTLGTLPIYDGTVI